MAKGKIAMNKVVFFLLVLCCSVRVTYSGFGFYRKKRGYMWLGTSTHETP